MGELFGQPHKSQWTPVEIVQHTVTLPGVAGAMIALQDGFLVAGLLPPPLSGEIIAAFLPQIFGRLNHYSQELKLGATSGLVMTLGSQALQIWKVGNLFFVGLSKANEPLPAVQLPVVLQQLTRQS